MSKSIKNVQCIRIMSHGVDIENKMETDYLSPDQIIVEVDRLDVNGNLIEIKEFTIVELVKLARRSMS